MISKCDRSRFDFQQLVPQLSPRFVDWLTKMVEPKLKHRYNTASLALETLKPIRVVGTATPIETLLGKIKRGWDEPGQKRTTLYKILSTGTAMLCPYKR